MKTQPEKHSSRLFQWIAPARANVRACGILAATVFAVAGVWALTHRTTMK